MFFLFDEEAAVVESLFTHTYIKGLGEILRTNLLGVDLKLMLVKDTYVFDAAHAALSEIIAHEISVSGYSRQTLTNRNVIDDPASGFSYLDADDVTFIALAAGQTIGGAVLFRHVTSDATHVPIVFFNTKNLPTSGINIKIRWAAAAAGGILRLKQAA